MDDLYDNLDNYNEENTIAELKTENKVLKSKLEEYAITLTKLQKEFDKLSSEYKQLELNYSSLLKTAKAEIERKTQLITNLNLKKDQMVLKAFHNKKSNVSCTTSYCDNTVIHQNHTKDKYESTKHDVNLKHFEGRKSSHHSATERKDQDKSPSRDQTDLRTKLLNLAHNGQQHYPIVEKNGDVKENIIQPKVEDSKARASIRNRRKSMPALSTEMGQFSDNDDLTNTSSLKNLQQTNTEQNNTEKYTHTDHDFSERPKSRISETSSLEEKKSGYHEQSPDGHRKRSSRHDRPKNDKHKGRHKSLHRNKKESSDRLRSSSREYHDPYYRSEYSRHRSKGRISISPPRDKNRQRPSRELQRSNHERRHPYEQERLPRSQERYATKRRMEHGYSGFGNKRVRMEPHSKQLEEDRKMELDKRMKIDSYSRNYEEDRKMKDERKPYDKKNVADPLEIQFSSCESPDYDYLDDPNLQVKEIKLTSTTKLDDPRICSKKYVLQRNDSQIALSTLTGRNVEIVPVRKSAWGITPVSIPEALIIRPPEPEQSARNICTEIENPANISMEPGEILDLEDLNIPTHLQKINKAKVSSGERKEILVLETKTNESKDLEIPLKNINSYKIPKLKKAVNEKHNSKENAISVKFVHDNADSFNSNKNSDTAITDFEMNEEQTKQDNFIIQSKNPWQSPGASNVYEQKHLTSKEVVEGDLEMSDDNEQSDHVIRDFVTSTELQTVVKEKTCNINSVKESIDDLQKVTLEPCKDKTFTSDSKKSKTKKKSKQKESTESSKIEDSVKIFEKPAKKKEKQKETKSKKPIKTKFSELFDDSSSLISPEDLGLAAVPVSTVRLSDKCIPFFEDALDAADLNTLKSDTIKESNPPEKVDVESKQHSDVTVTKIGTITTVSREGNLEKPNDVQTELTDDIIKSIYQNLEPGAPEQEDNVVKTVIISSGVQPPLLLEEEKQVCPNKIDPHLKAIRDCGLKALATSTPHKKQIDVVMADKEVKLSDLSCTSNNSQIASVENTVMMDKSDSNTVDSQTIEANMPDVRIFVKRKRKFIKK